jgi:hypothetical protein
MATAVKTRCHWRKADHLHDPVAVAASLVQTGETSVADDDVVAAVCSGFGDNRTPATPTRGSTLPTPKTTASTTLQTNISTTTTPGD